MIGALVLGGVAFLAIYIMTAAEGEVFHAPPAWFVAAIYGAGAAAIGMVVGGVIGAIILAVGQGGTTRHVVWAELAVLALYLPYFALPVFEQDFSVYRGWDHFMKSIFNASPIALGHVLFWLGLANLATRRWWLAFALALAALLVTLTCLAIDPIPGAGIGLYFELFSMGLLMVISLAFARRAGSEKLLAA